MNSNEVLEKIKVDNLEWESYDKYIDGMEVYQSNTNVIIKYFLNL